MDRINTIIQYAWDSVKALLFSGAFIGSVAGFGIAVANHNMKSFEPEQKFHTIERTVPKGDMSTLAFITQYGDLPSEKIEIKKQQIFDFYTAARGICKRNKLEDLLNLGLATALAESQINPEAVSKAGALGLYQLMPETFGDLERIITVLKTKGKLAQDYSFSPGLDEYRSSLSIQAEAGFLVLVENYIQSGNDISTALALHNAGSKNVQDAQKKAKKLKNFQSFYVYSQFLPMPGETIPYVAKVKKHLAGIKSNGFVKYANQQVIPAILPASETWAESLLKDGQYERALVQWRDIEKLRKDSKFGHARALYNMGLCYEGMGRHDLAIDVFSKASDYRIKEYYESSIKKIEKLS